MAYEDDGKVIFMEGNYSDYEDDRKERLGDAALVPSSAKHRKIT